MNNSTIVLTVVQFENYCVIYICLTIFGAHISSLWCGTHIILMLNVVLIQILSDKMYIQMYAGCSLTKLNIDIILLQQTDGEPGSVSPSDAIAAANIDPNVGPKRLHVSNIPFRFREADLKSLLGVSVW